MIPNNNDESIKNRAMLFHLVYMEGASRGEIISWNKNLGGIAMKDKTGKINNYPIIMNNVKKEYICLKDGFNITLPYFVFETYEDSIKSLHLLIKNTFTNIDASNITTDSFDENTLTTSLFRNWLRNWIIKEEFDLTDLTNNNKEKINELKLKTGRSVNIMKAKDLLI